MQEKQEQEQTKKCPFCAEEINIEAIKCKHCGEIIDKKKIAKKKKNNFAGIGCLVIIILFIIISFSGCGSSDDHNSSDINNSSLNTNSNSKSTKTQSDTKQTTELLELISYKCYSEHSYFHIVGEVKNISSKSLENVTAVGTAYTDNGEFVKSDDALIDYNPILPGQSSPFEVLMTDNPEIKKCKIDFKELFGGSIPTKEMK